MYSILLVDDDKLVLKSLIRLLRSSEYELDCVTSSKAALKQCESGHYHLIISDQRMPGMLGTELLGEIRKKFPDIRRILLSAYADFNNVTDAFNNGIIHKFILKPWNNAILKKVVIDQLRFLDDSISSPGDPVFSFCAETTNSELGDADRKYKELDCFHGIFSSDPLMLQQISIIQKTANAEAPYFVCGETGTGKELFARAIHNESSRRDEKFVAVNCANLTETLLESQLFGHVKGAFTGAQCNQEGMFAAADGGTLFLDEVIEIPLSLQAKLLRALQEREFVPLGKTCAIPFDVQIISASSLSFAEAVELGKLRQELRYRLEVMPITLPPLRHRPSDIGPLFEKFLREQLHKYNHHVPKVDPLVYEYLAEYAWPGNVRELLNVCTYVAALVDAQCEVITLDCLPDVITMTSATTKCSASLPSSISGADAQLTKLHNLDRISLKKVLAEFSGRREDAARFLGVSRMTLWRKMKLFELTS